MLKVIRCHKDLFDKVHSVWQYETICQTEIGNYSWWLVCHCTTDWCFIIGQIPFCQFMQILHELCIYMLHLVWNTSSGGWKLVWMESTLIKTCFIFVWNAKSINQYAVSDWGLFFREYQRVASLNTAVMSLVAGGKTPFIMWPNLLLIANTLEYVYSRGWFY